jgi:hypothetical protein
MKFSSIIFWEWHKVDNYVVMCRNGEGKPYTEPSSYNVITKIDNTYKKVGEVDSN